MLCLFLEAGKEGKRKVREREGVVEEEEGCEETTDLHSASASGQRQLELYSSLKEKRHHQPETASEIKYVSSFKKKETADRYLRLQERTKEEKDSTKTIFKKVSVNANAEIPYIISDNAQN